MGDGGTRSNEERSLRIDVDGVSLDGDLGAPDDPVGIVVFAHGSGSSRRSVRNRSVAAGLHEIGLVTLLFDLLTEEEGADRRRVFDIPLLAERLVAAVDRVSQEPGLTDLPIGLFGASTGAAAALDAAAEAGERVTAVVSRGGRPDLATRAGEVVAPVLLIVGGADHPVLELNREAAKEPAGEVEVVVIDGAGHLFEGPGELEQVSDHAAGWFARHLR